MQAKAFMDLFLKKAREMGFEAEISQSQSNQFRVQVYEGSIEQYSVSDTISVSVKGLKDGRMSGASTTVMDEAAVDQLLRQLLDASQVLEDDTPMRLFEGSEAYPQVKVYDDALSDISARAKIDMALELEKLVKAQDARVRAVQPCMLSSFEQVSRVASTKGMALEKKKNGIIMAAAPLVEADGEKQSGYSHRLAWSLEDIDLEALAREAVKEGVDYLGAKPVLSGTYPAVIRKEVMADFLYTFQAVFSAEEAMKNATLLWDKRGEMVASELVSIIDDPLMDWKSGSTPYDGEGVACFSKPIVQNGTLKTLLTNLRSAAKLGLEPTANASGSQSVSATNLYMVPGDADFESILKACDKGIYITDFDGGHAGANAVSGDFSLSARGFVIEGGKLGRPVNQIVISGNFFDLLKGICLVGNDLKFSDSTPNIGAPTVMIEALAVSGR